VDKSGGQTLDWCLDFPAGQVAGADQNAENRLEHVMHHLEGK
jgi:hypothetical protein